MSEVSRRDDEIYADHIAGFTNKEIATRNNVDANEVGQVIHRFRTAVADTITGTDRAQLVALETQRLDALQARYWRTAMNGEIKDAEFVLKVMDRRAKMLGLDKPIDQAAVSRLVLIAGSTKDEFMEALREAQLSEQGAEFGEAPTDILEGELEEDTA